MPKTSSAARRFGAVLAASAVLGFTGAGRAEQVVQVPLDQTFLNGRTVTTLTGGSLVPWTKGVDGGGSFSGYMTKAASVFNKDPENLIGLPSDGVFAATTRHPEVVLHFADDADAASQQTHFVQGAGVFTFAVPVAKYAKLFLFATSAEGESPIKVTLKYTDENQVVPVVVPDYYAGVDANDPVIFNLATNLPKWSKAHQVLEADHHNLTGIELAPLADKPLTGVTVEKDEQGYLVFWGATGIAAGSVAGMGGMGGQAAVAGAAGDGAVSAGRAGSNDGQVGASGGTAAAGATSGDGGNVPGGTGGSASGSPAVPGNDGFQVQGPYAPQAGSSCSVPFLGSKGVGSLGALLCLFAVMALRRRGEGLPFARSDTRLQDRHSRRCQICSPVQSASSSRPIRE